VNVCSIRFHHVYSPLLGGRSSLSEPHSCIFHGSFWRPVWPSPLGAGADQAMLFQITVAGAAHSINTGQKKMRINKNFTDL